MGVRRASSLLPPWVGPDAVGAVLGAHQSCPIPSPYRRTWTNSALGKRSQALSATNGPTYSARAAERGACTGPKPGRGSRLRVPRSERGDPMPHWQDDRPREGGWHRPCGLEHVLQAPALLGRRGCASAGGGRSKTGESPSGRGSASYRRGDVDRCGGYDQELLCPASNVGGDEANRSADLQKRHAVCVLP